MILFLYDEDIFTKEIFNDFAATMSWDKGRFSKMLKDRYIKNGGTENKHKGLTCTNLRSKLNVYVHTCKKTYPRRNYI